MNAKTRGSTHCRFTSRTIHMLRSCEPVITHYGNKNKVFLYKTNLLNLHIHNAHRYLFVLLVPDGRSDTACVTPPFSLQVSHAFLRKSLFALGTGTLASHSKQYRDRTYGIDTIFVSLTSSTVIPIPEVWDENTALGSWGV